MLLPGFGCGVLATCGRRGGGHPQEHGEVLETREAGEPFRMGDKLTLADGIEVAIGVDNHVTPVSWNRTVHIGDIFDSPGSTPN